MNSPSTGGKDPHTHTLEYCQTGEDFQKGSVQVRCTTCSYKSYSIALQKGKL